MNYTLVAAAVSGTVNAKCTISAIWHVIVCHMLFPIRLEGIFLPKGRPKHNGGAKLLGALSVLLPDDIGQYFVVRRESKHHALPLILILMPIIMDRADIIQPWRFERWSVRGFSMDLGSCASEKKKFPRYSIIMLSRTEMFISAVQYRSLIMIASI